MRIFLLIFCILTAFSSCKKDEERVVNGARIVFKINEDTPVAEKGDSIYYHLVLLNRTKMNEGVLKKPLNSTYEVGKLKKQPVVKPRFTGGFEEALPYLSVGDSVIVYVNGSVLYSNPKLTWKHPMIEKGDQLEYYIKVTDIKRKKN